MQIKPGCIVVVVIGRFSIAKLCARDRDRGTLGSSEDLDRGADGTCDAVNILISLTLILHAYCVTKI